MDKSIVLRLPNDLEYLTRPPARARELARSSDDRSLSVRMEKDLPNAALQRVNRVSRAEIASGTSAARPDWLGGSAIPRLVITARYEGADAFGASRLLTDLDLAARRTVAVQRRLLRAEQPKTMPRAIPTHQGGLRILEASEGSFEVVLTMWGALVSLATSSPVAVAGLFSLIWDVTRAGFTAAHWIGGLLADGEAERPSLAVPAVGLKWGVKHTKALLPVMESAVEQGQGFELLVDEGSQQIKLTVLPKARD